MTQFETGGRVSASVLRAAEQLSRPGVGSIVATGAQTGGDFGLFRGELAAGTEVAGHYHLTFSESFYVLSGSVSLHDGRRWTDAGPGDLLHVPRRGIHALRVPADGPAEVLTLFTPGIAREHFVLELLEIRTSGRQLSAEEWRELYERHDQYLVDPGA